MIAFAQFAQNQPLAHAILVLATVCATGLAIGSIKYRRVGLGAAGVLFVGIVFGHCGERINPVILDFMKDFGLVLFVFTIGLQLGPGFVSSMRQDGVRLNALAAAIIFLGTAITVAGAAFLKIDFAAALGLFSGATTNTPSLGAAQQALATLPGLSADRAALPALAYAVSYPVGVAGIIGSMVILRAVLRVDATRESESFLAQQRKGIDPLARMNLLVDNPNLEGISIGDLPGRRETGVVVSRIRRAGASEVEPAVESTVLHPGDTILAVGNSGGLAKFARIVGRLSDVDLMALPGQVTNRRVAVTHKEVLGKTLGQLGLNHLHRVTVTRVTRAGLELSALQDLRLQFGDVLQVVGEPDDIERAAVVLGNSLSALNETQFIPIFIGIALGILAGVLPISFPGMPVPVRLGLAGGPLVVAIGLSRIGHFGRLVWHMPLNANMAFRELGLTLFLACVGLKAGDKFFAAAFSTTGLLWVGCAVCITVIPLIAVGIFARKALQLNFLTLSGLIAGSTTDTTALAFAGSIAKSDAPLVAYATVYPISMLLRILTAQALALLFCR